MALPFQSKAQANPKTTLALTAVAGAIVGGLKGALIGGVAGGVLLGVAGVKKALTSFSGEPPAPDPFNFAIFGQDDGTGGGDDSNVSDTSYDATQGFADSNWTQNDDTTIADQSYDPGAGQMVLGDSGGGDSFVEGSDLPDDQSDDVWSTSDDSPEEEYDEGEDQSDGSYDDGGGGGSGGGSAGGGSSGGGGSGQYVGGPSGGSGGLIPTGGVVGPPLPPPVSGGAAGGPSTVPMGNIPPIPPTSTMPGAVVPLGGPASDALQAIQDVQAAGLARQQAQMKTDQAAHLASVLEGQRRNQLAQVAIAAQQQKTLAARAAADAAAKAQLVAMGGRRRPIPQVRQVGTTGPSVRPTIQQYAPVVSHQVSNQGLTVLSSLARRR